MKIHVTNPEAVVKQAFWLAWNACRGPVGMGFLQNNPSATIEDVWKNVRSAGDYGVGADKITKASEIGKAYGDYVFGRMMKLSIEWDESGVIVKDSEPQPDYQVWCRVYKTYEELIKEAIKSLS